MMVRTVSKQFEKVRFIQKNMNQFANWQKSYQNVKEAIRKQKKQIQIRDL